MVQAPLLGLQRQTSGSAIAALCLGISAFIPWIGVVTGIMAIIFGVKGRREVDANPQLVSGRGMATTGLVLGIVGACLWVLAFIIVMAATFFVLVSDVGSTGTGSPSPTITTAGPTSS